MRTLALLVALSPASLAQDSVDEVTMLRLGLGPEQLAAAGVTSGEVAGIVSDVGQSTPILQGDFGTADAAVSAAQQDVYALRPIIRSGNSTEQEKQDYQAAKDALAQALVDRDAVLDSIFTAGVADLFSAEQATLTQLRANMDRRGYATELLVVSRTDQEWIDLKRALDHEKACAKSGEEEHPDVTSYLAGVRSQTDVAAAKSNLDSNLDSVRTAWESALSE